MNENLSVGLPELDQVGDMLEIYKNIALDGNEQIISSFARLNFPSNDGLDSNEYSFFRVQQLSFDDDYPRREAMENVLLSVDDEAYNFVYILTGSPQGVELCLGIVKKRQ